MDETDQKYACFMAAKYEVSRLGRQGRMLSPEEALCLAGHSKGLETLWSVAFRLAGEYDVDVNEVNAYLEAQFPQHRTGRDRGRDGLTWHECTRHDL